MNQENERIAGRQPERRAEWLDERFEAKLDELLAEPHAAPPALAKRILEALPSQSRRQRFLDWLTPAGGEVGLWRPVAAALVPLAFGFALGLGVGAPGGDPLQDDVLLIAFSDSYIESAAYGGEGDD